MNFLFIEILCESTSATCKNSFASLRKIVQHRGTTITLKHLTEQPEKWSAVGRKQIFHFSIFQGSITASKKALKTASSAYF